MNHFDNDQKLKIGELVITVKLVSLIFLAIAIFMEIPKFVLQSDSLFGIKVSVGLYKILLASAVILTLFMFLMFLVTYYQKRFIKGNYTTDKQIIYDIVEIYFFILLDTILIIMSGLNQSPYKIIFLFIMISVTIQHGVRYGIIVSSICSAIILSIDLIAVPVRPNPYFQIDLMLCGVCIMTTWLLGYYRSVEMEYSLKMASIAITDDLTGLYSHGYFQAKLNEQIIAAKENNKPLSLLFMDLDYFKYFNDLYGHQEGDEVLKAIGVILKSYSSEIYLPARYGGEEFTILMNETTEQTAVAFAEKIRLHIETAFVNKFPEIGKITVSIGVSSFPSKAKNKEELIKYADDALYRAKSFHRNRVETYHSVLEELKGDIDGDDIEIVSSMRTLISIINSKDKYTYRHIERVVIYCGLIADVLNLSINEKKMLKYGAYLHDIGKINMPQEVLNKKMPLTNEEWTLLKQHPTFGVEIISPVKSLADAIPIILYHHERFDGKGYPGNLLGNDIPYLARILTVADSFDAMTSNRPYGVAKTFDEGIEELRACSSMEFDPDIVETFIKILRSKSNIF